VKKISMINLDARTLRSLQQGTDEFCAEHRLSIGGSSSILLDVITQTTKLMTSVGGDSKWFGYLTLDVETRVIVGTCAFKGPPDHTRSVEIAYFTFPEYEHQGYATAMASMLLQAARSSPDVEHVIAHTLPEENASTHILRKLGMTCSGEVVDPEDGTVWRWSL